MLALRLTWRNAKSGELTLLGAALMLAVAVVGGVAIFTTRLEATLNQESHMLLGADALVQSAAPAPPAWQARAHGAGLSQTQTVRFASMVYAGDAMHLASVRAVGEGYPLRGEVALSQTPFAVNAADIVRADSIPPPGEVWADSRLLPLLGISLGDAISIGEASFTLRELIIREPDASSPFSFMGAALMMNLRDLDATKVVQPGSRVQYQWLLAGAPGEVKRFLADLEPEFSAHERVVDVSRANRGLARALDTGRQFLLLGSVMGVLLAGVAIAIAARQFADRHTHQVALLKSLGASRGRLRRLYLQQLTLVGLSAAMAGLLAAELLQRAIAAAVLGTYQLTLAPPSAVPYLLSLLAGLICVLCFALPALWHLPRVPPLKILRRELKLPTVQLVWQIVFALLAVVGVTVLFSRDLALAATILAALALVLVIVGAAGFGLLRLARRVSGNAGSIARLAAANLLRRLDHTLVQLTVFAIALLLLVVLTVARTSLLQDWQAQVPDDAPNHFLVNVPAYEVEAVRALLDDRNINREPIYPMVRGRLTAINDGPLSDSQREVGSINREANLTWAATLGGDNRIVAGHWWDSWRSTSKLPGVSVEAELARELGLRLGDRLAFSLGGLSLNAEVASFRTLDWRSMKPNFFFVFEPGSLAPYSPTYMTSFYLPASEKRFISTLLTAHPAALVVEIDKILAQIQMIIQQVSNGILLVLVLIIVGGALVLAAAVGASLASRKQEHGLLRALGSPRRLLAGSIWLEFTLLGTFAGFIAVLGAELLLLGLQHFVLNTPMQPHWQFWLLTPLAGGVFIGLLGWLSLRRLLATPPAAVLREAA